MDVGGAGFTVMNFKSVLFSTLAMLSALLYSCRPEPDGAQLVDQLVVSTNYDNEVDFKQYNTYAIPTDTIGFVSNTASDTILVASRSDYPRPVLSLINSNLGARGYSRVDRTADPDLGVRVLVANDFNVFQSVYYPNNYYNGYYGYSSYYYNYPYVRTYVKNTGVLIIEIVDLKNRTPDNKVRVIWTAYLGDVFSTLDLQKETDDAINQAFTQSPYLSK